MALGMSPDLPRTDDLVTVKPWVLRVLKPLGTFLLRRWWRIRVHGAAAIPASGPVILAANHVGIIDGPLLGWMSPRSAFTMGKAELFTGLLGRALLLTGQIPVDRHRPHPDALRRCVRLLRDGEVLIIYPEGVRGPGEFAWSRPGLAYLAMVTGAPIVPVALIGTREPGQSTGQLPRRGGRMHVVFGTPFQVDTRPWPRRRDDVARLTEHIRVILAAHVRQAQDTIGMSLPGPPKPRTARPKDPQHDRPVPTSAL